MAFGWPHELTDLTAVLLQHPLAVTRLRPLVVTLLAIAPPAIFASGTRMEITQWLGLAAVTARAQNATVRLPQIGHMVSFPPFLDIASHEFFGVFFEDGVDFVEEVVYVLADLLNALGDFWVDLGGYFFDFLVAARLA